MDMFSEIVLSVWLSSSEVGPRTRDYVLQTVQGQDRGRSPKKLISPHKPKNRPRKGRRDLDLDLDLHHCSIFPFLRALWGFLRRSHRSKHTGGIPVGGLAQIPLWRRRKTTTRATM
mmetsp:Transcript_27515/g.42078  ORF Transcript_27515/g.42078 Transcript_27515/m.42078 type:complete len:116 (-) Transcript_27515:252-599(-)